MTLPRWLTATPYEVRAAREQAAREERKDGPAVRAAIDEQAVTSGASRTGLEAWVDEVVWLAAGRNIRFTDEVLAKLLRTRPCSPHALISMLEDATEVRSAEVHIPHGTLDSQDATI